MEPQDQCYSPGFGRVSGSPSVGQAPGGPTLPSPRVGHSASLSPSAGRCAFGPPAAPRELHAASSAGTDPEGHLSRLREPGTSLRQRLQGHMGFISGLDTAQEVLG